jgi:tRNA 2-selenouridine synthase
MITTIDCNTFLNKARTKLVVDVRSPAEYAKAHIPGAINIPLFNDAERVAVGTTYKQQSKQLAILQGLDFVGPKMRNIIEAVNNNTKDNEIQVYCWRGGMRSGSIAWLLSSYGYSVTTLQGGYKAYRNLVLAELKKDWPLQVVGGRTGVGKTIVLQELAKRGNQIIDLEAIANHKGSAFGMIGQAPQPSQEKFENLLYNALSACNINKTIFVEDESRKIGTCIIPDAIFSKIRNTKVHYINLPIEERLRILNEQYGSFDKAILIERMQSIAKRLGPNETKTAIAHIQEGNMLQAIALCLKYYDKTYDFGLSKREKQLLMHIEVDKFDAEYITNIIKNNE